MRSAASGMKLSAPRNAAVAMMRQAMIAGSPRLRREDACRKQTSQRRDGECQADERGGDGEERVRELQPGHQHADADGGHDGSGDLAAHPIERQRAVAQHRSYGQGADSESERHQPEEHPLPPERVGDPPGQERSEQAGQHPTRRQVGVHHRLPIVWKRPLDEHVRDGREAACSGALQRATDNDPSHRRRHRRHDEPDHQRHDAQRERQCRAAAVGHLAGRHERHQVGEGVDGQRHAVERVAAQLVGDGGQRSDHRRDLERDQHHRQHQARGEQPLLGGERGADFGARGCCHTGEPGATSGHGWLRSAVSATSSSSCSV